MENKDKQKSLEILMKLYKMNLNEEYFEKTVIENIQDVEIENKFNKILWVWSVNNLYNTI